MKALAKEVVAGLAFVAIGVVVSLGVVLVHDVEASPDPGVSYVYRGMVPFHGQQCYDWEHDPNPYWRQFHIDGWQSCWHLTEPGYPAIDYNRGDQTEDSAVWLDYEGDFQLFKIMPYEDDCTGVRAEIYWGSYAPGNYRGDIHYLHIEPNPLWLYQEVPYQAVYIGDVTREDDPDCSWFGFHLHQSADWAASTPFYSNKFVDPSQDEEWQHAIMWEAGGGDQDGDEFTNADELYIGTDPFDDCPDNSSDDAWPPDINNDTEVGIADVMEYFAFGAYPSELGEPGYDNRLDLTADGRINIADIMMFFAFGDYGTQCSQ